MTIKRLLLLLGLLGWASSTFAQKGTLTPDPWFTVLDNSGNPINGACIWQYVAGTTTTTTTYQDVNLSSANANPIIVGSDGRATIYLVPGQSFKYTVESPPCSSSSHGTLLKTQDNINAVPTSSNNIDVTGTVGETIAAGLCAYLSDGSGGKNAGQWYRCDSTNTYSATTPEVGMVPTQILSGATGTIRLSGSVPGLSSLSIGSEYFVGTAGAITSTAPANKRHLGHADTATSLVLTGNPSASLGNLFAGFPGIPCGRLTLTTGTPVTINDVTAATTLYYTPYSCNTIALFDGTATWNLRTLTEISIAVPATTSQMYDVFVFDSSGTPTLELLAWTNDTTRATNLTLQNAALVKLGATTRRYVGSFRTTGVSGQTEDSAVKRYVWNFYNRVLRVLHFSDAAANWTTASTTFVQANGSTADQVDAIIGVVEDSISVTLNAIGQTSGGSGATFEVGIGIDSASTATLSQPITSAGAAFNYSFSMTYNALPSLGRHFYAWLNKVGSNTGTFFGTGAGTGSGLYGWIKG